MFVSPSMRLARHPALMTARGPCLTLVGVTTRCPSGLLRVLDAIIVTGGVPAEVTVRRAAASFRFAIVVTDCPASPDRLRDRIAQIVGVRMVVAALQGGPPC